MAGLALWGIARGRPGFEATGNMAANGYGEHSPGGYDLVAVFVAEVLLTAVFLYVILGATDSRAPQGFAPIAIGLVLTLIHLVSIPISNTSVNPARSTGVAFFNGDGAPGQLWVFWLAPILGAAIAGATFHLITGVDRRDRDISGEIARARTSRRGRGPGRRPLSTHHSAGHGPRSPLVGGVLRGRRPVGIRRRDGPLGRVVPEEQVGRDRAQHVPGAVLLEQRVRVAPRVAPLARRPDREGHATARRARRARTATSCRGGPAPDERDLDRDRGQQLHAERRVADVAEQGHAAAAQVHRHPRDDGDERRRRPGTPARGARSRISA